MWRLMLRYPELLAWEMLWTDSLRDTYKAIYDSVKAVRPSAGVTMCRAEAKRLAVMLAVAAALAWATPAGSAEPAKDRPPVVRTARNGAASAP